MIPVESRVESLVLDVRSESCGRIFSESTEQSTVLGLVLDASESCGRRFSKSTEQTTVVGLAIGAS